MSLKFDVFGITDIGTTKAVNQDCFTYRVVDVDNEYSGVFAVADGVGGLDSGEIASSIAIYNVNEWWENEFKSHYDDYSYIVKSLIDCMHQSNIDIIEESKANNIRSASTLSILLLYKNLFTIVHTGDSRIYRVRGTLIPKMELLTQDQSCLVQRNINGQIVMKSVLTECLGNREMLNHYCNNGEYKKNDIFILGSDGICKKNTDSEILSIVRANRNNMQQLSNTMVNTVKSKGETDNITSISIKIID